jgi:hypothetical protein
MKILAEIESYKMLVWGKDKKIVGFRSKWSINKS